MGEANALGGDGRLGGLFTISDLFCVNLRSREVFGG